MLVSVNLKWNHQLVVKKSTIDVNQFATYFDVFC